MGSSGLDGEMTASRRSSRFQQRAVQGLQILAAWLAAGACGWLASLANIPLAWVLGPLAATATLSLCGVGVFAPLMGRRAGQVVVGAAIGLAATAETAVGIIAWLPMMILVALVMVALGAFLSVFLARFARVDETTAFLAMMPGGMAEMANIGDRVGARSDIVAIIQAIRVTMVVLTLPAIATLLSSGAPWSIPAPQGYLGPGEILLVLAACLLAVAVSRRIPLLANTWLIGALIAAAILASTGIVAGAMPPMLFAAGQYLIGIFIGARFTRSSLKALPRASAVGVGFIAQMIVMSLLVSWAMSAIVGFDHVSAVLMVSPGGMAEVGMAAKLLHLNAALILGFHIARSIIINGLGIRLLWICDRLGIRNAARTVLN